MSATEKIVDTPHGPGRLVVQRARKASATLLLSHGAGVGIDTRDLEALAADLGVELEFVPTDWKTLGNGVVAGKYHLTGSASISPARTSVSTVRRYSP